MEPDLTQLELSHDWIVLGKHINTYTDKEEDLVELCIDWYQVLEVIDMWVEFYREDFQLDQIVKVEDYVRSVTIDKLLTNAKIKYQQKHLVAISALNEQKKLKRYQEYLELKKEFEE